MDSNRRGQCLVRHDRVSGNLAPRTVYYGIYLGRRDTEEYTGEYRFFKTSARASRKGTLDPKICTRLPRETLCQWILPAILESSISFGDRAGRNDRHAGENHIPLSLLSGSRFNRLSRPSPSPGHPFATPPTGAYIFLIGFFPPFAESGRRALSARFPNLNRAPDRFRPAGSSPRTSSEKGTANVGTEKRARGGWRRGSQGG